MKTKRNKNGKGTQMSDMGRGLAWEAEVGIAVGIDGSDCSGDLDSNSM